MADKQGVKDLHLYDEQEKKMKVLVIGKSGWIGGYVLNELKQRGDIELVDEGIPDAIIYLAWSNLKEFNSINHIEFALHSYELLKYYIDNGVRDITVTGTCLEYGKVNGELSEDMTPNPIVNYAIGKDLLRRLLSQFDIDLKWLRLFYIYGEGQKESSLIPTIDRLEKEGQKEFELPGWKRTRDYLHVEDVAKYIVDIALQSEQKGIINVCSGKPRTLYEFVKSYININKYSIDMKQSDKEYDDLAPDYFWGCNKKLKRILE
jgi:nucleoside-diphosphate-sugar epimerase